MLASPLFTPGQIAAVCFDWGNTLMSEDGPQDRVMALWPEVRAIDGAAECLQRLSGRLPLCIATNATASRQPMIQRALDRVGLGQYVQHIFCYTELGFRKSQREFWLAVSRQLQMPLERIAMLGDSLEQDCVAPRSFGVQAVWFNEAGRQPYTGAERVPVVTRLDDFATSVEQALDSSLPSGPVSGAAT